MRILHVIPGLTVERGGPTAVVQAVARHQAEAGHQVVVLATDQGARHGEHLYEFSRPVEVECLPVRGPDRLAFAPGFARAVRRRLGRCDIAHVHSIFTYPVHRALCEAATVGVPVILRPCGHLHRYSLQNWRWFKRSYLAVWGEMLRKTCTAWHYTSREEQAESWAGPSSCGFVLRNGIEARAFALDRNEARRMVGQSWPVLQGAPYVLYLGRLHAKKRLDLLVEAFLRGAPPEFKLVVAGPDPGALWPALAARCLRDAGSVGRVLRVGMIHGHLKTALLAGATVFALPSEHENFGIAALEALAAGTPVLLSPRVDFARAALAAGLAETAPLEVEAWQGALAALLANPSRWRTVSKGGPMWVRATYDWNPIAEEMVRRYRWVMAGCPPESPTAAVAGRHQEEARL